MNLNRNIIIVTSFIFSISSGESNSALNQVGNLNQPNLLDLVSLRDYPKAVCNDGTPAVYYRHKENTDNNYRKMLIFLKGGGLCVPFVPGFDCISRCKNNVDLCSARTDPYFDIEGYGHFGSSDPVINPAFHDFDKGPDLRYISPGNNLSSSVFVPYCSSDVYTGTRSATELTENLYFHGHYIVSALIDDLIRNTWITEAEQVVLMGGSAGAIGTEANCDYFAEQLHQHNQDIDVKCISDSGSLYPYHTHTQLCDPHLLEFAAFEMWNSVSDQSCMEANPIGYNCISATNAYPYVETPTLLIMSSEDTTIRICYDNDPEFWQQWRDELAAIARRITEERPEAGVFIPNCPFHQGLFSNLTYWGMEVPLIDGDSDDDVIVLRNLLVNFMKAEHPYQAIDDMAVRNPKCNKI